MRSSDNRLLSLLFFILTWLSVLRAQPVSAQQARPVTVEIETKDAARMKGKLIGIVRDSVRFVDQQNRERRIALNEVRNIEYLDSARASKRWFEAPNTLRYLLSSTAIPLRKNELALQATYGLLVSVHYGISDRLSIGGGTDIFTRSTSFINAKVNLVNRPRYKFSGGLNYYRLPRETNSVANDELRDLTMVYGAATWGNTSNHFTIGAGYMFARGSFLPPIVTVSGTARIAKRFALVTENWFLFVGSHTDLPVLISLGARYISKRSSLDFGFYNDHKFSLDTGFPYLGYTFKFKMKE